MACVRSNLGGEVVPGPGYDPARGTTRVRPHPKNWVIAGEMVVPYEGTDPVRPGTTVTSYPVVSPYRGTARGTTPLWPHVRRRLGALTRRGRTLSPHTLSAHGLGSSSGLRSRSTHLRGAGRRIQPLRSPTQAEGTPAYPVTRRRFPRAPCATAINGPPLRRPIPAPPPTGGNLAPKVAVTTGHSPKWFAFGPSTDPSWRSIRYPNIRSLPSTSRRASWPQ